MSERAWGFDSPSAHVVELEQMVVEVQVRFDAPPDEVYALLHDVGRMAGLGPEHEWAAWTSPTTFTGRNRMGEREWEVTCHVIADDPPHRFAFTVDVPDNPSSTWSYGLAEVDGGTLVTQRMQHGPGSSGLRAFCAANPDRAEAAVRHRSESLRANMAAVLTAANELLSRA